MKPPLVFVRISPGGIELCIANYTEDGSPQLTTTPITYERALGLGADLLNLAVSRIRETSYER